MRRLLPTLLVIGLYCTVLALRVGEAGGPATAAAAQQERSAEGVAPTAAAPSGAPTKSPDNAAIEKYCLVCHNERRKIGGLSLAGFDADLAAQHPEIAEKIVGKLRVGLMPPRRAPQPAGEWR